MRVAIRFSNGTIKYPAHTYAQEGLTTFNNWKAEGRGKTPLIPFSLLQEGLATSNTWKLYISKQLVLPLMTCSCSHRNVIDNIQDHNF